MNFGRFWNNGARQPRRHHQALAFHAFFRQAADPLRHVMSDFLLVRVNVSAHAVLVGPVHVIKLGDGRGVHFAAVHEIDARASPADVEQVLAPKTSPIAVRLVDVGLVNVQLPPPRVVDHEPIQQAQGRVDFASRHGHQHGADYVFRVKRHEALQARQMARVQLRGGPKSRVENVLHCEQSFFAKILFQKPRSKKKTDQKHAHKRPRNQKKV